MENIRSSNASKKNYLINRRNISYQDIVTLRFMERLFYLSINNISNLEKLFFFRKIDYHNPLFEVLF